MEAYLVGKKIEAPVVEPTEAEKAEAIVLESIEVKWGEKSVWWILRRISVLLLYTTLLATIGFGPIFIFLNRYSAVRPPAWFSVVMISCFAFMFIGPIMAYLIWFSFKKKKVLRELQMRENEE